MTSLYYPGQCSVSTLERCCWSGKWWVGSSFKFLDERFCATTNHYIIFHIQPQLLSGFEVLQLTYYMLSWALWNCYLYKVGGRLAIIVNVISSWKLSAHIVVLNGEEKQTRRGDNINNINICVVYLIIYVMHSHDKNFKLCRNR